MEEINIIISAISEQTHIPKWDILLGNKSHAVMAHKFLCHIVMNCYPHLMNKLSGALDKNLESIRNAVADVDRRISSSHDLRYMLNRIRRVLGLPLIKESKRKVRRAYISDTKRLFGFDYSDKDIIRRYNAIKSANQFMDKYCSYGRQPIDVGMVFTTAKPKRTYNSWYNN